MKSISIMLIMAMTIISLGFCNSCISKHCQSQQANCKGDKSDLPCTNIINTCLDYCPTNTSYACISLCISSRKNDAANKVLCLQQQLISCCSEFSCKVQKFAAVSMNLLLQQ